MFSDVLLTVDFDRTLTAQDSTIPQRNLDAIRYFMENGGTFTMNTGRSTNTFRNYFDVIPVNAPFLLYNGSAAYHNGELLDICPIDLDFWETIDEVHRLFPELNLEIGCWYLRDSLNKFKDYDHALELALARYNAGLSRARRWTPAEKKAPVLDNITIPSTRKYVSNIMERYARYRSEKK